MDFKDVIKQLGERVLRLKDQIQTEEATKNAFIMPFIQALGYDVFNPIEVVPEFTADIGIKKGEKVDYAILIEGRPQILIECKWWGENLDLHGSQLFRYFHTTKAKFGLLSNGIVYRFYTDLIDLNKMDEKPFLEFDITNVKEQTINELKKFHKSYFDVNNITNSASELKYSSEIKIILNNELANPSPNFVKYFLNQIYAGRTTEKVLVQFTEIVKRSLNQFISDIISDRLKTALDNENTKEIETAKQEAEPKEEASKIVTTQEEIESFFVVKSILRARIDSKRIVYRDFQNFFAILLDDTVRQPICRFYFSDNKKIIALIDENKKEVRHEIKSFDEIFNFADQITATAERYLKGSKPAKEE